MKKLHLIALLLVATATPACATDEAAALLPSPELAYLAHLLAPARIARGMSPAEVQASIGAPNATLAPNVWVYWNFKAKDTPGGDRCDTALVVFAHNRVDRVKLCEGAPVRAFIARQEALSPKSGPHALAAK
ncbi:MAG: hypothetical protein FJ399_20110 [Verrucomicrobia bacterium]|nr:hypothetical protein [Verrucomicrobiota bacterium]